MQRKAAGRGGGIRIDARFTRLWRGASPVGNNHNNGVSYWPVAVAAPTTAPFLAYKRDDANAAAPRLAPRETERGTLYLRRGTRAGTGALEARKSPVNWRRRGRILTATVPRLGSGNAQFWARESWLISPATSHAKKAGCRQQAAL